MLPRKAADACISPICSPSDFLKRLVGWCFYFGEECDKIDRKTLFSDRGCNVQQFLTMAQVQASLFVYLAVGFFLRKRGMITDAGRSMLSDLAIYVFLPCAVFASFQNGVGIEQLIGGGFILLISFVQSGFAWLVGRIAFRNCQPEQGKILRYGTLIANSAFAGLPVLEQVYGTMGVFYGSIYIIPNRIMMWTAGMALFQEEKNEKLTAWLVKIFLNPGMIAVFLGVGRMLLPFSIPGFIDTAVSAIGGCTTAIPILIVGSILADTSVKNLVDKNMIFIVLIRLFLLPATALLMMKGLGFGAVETGTAVILSGMPVGSTTAILAEKYGADAGFGSRCIFVTTLLSLFTIPLFAALI